MLPVVANLFTPESEPGSSERIIDLIAGPDLRLEHIISHGAPSPPGHWYDQDTAEWVALLRGSAVLEFEADRRLELAAGDHLLIPPNLRHRVAVCSDDAIWLALHLPGVQPPAA